MAIDTVTRCRFGVSFRRLLLHTGPAQTSQLKLGVHIKTDGKTMSMQKSASASSWLTYTDGIASRWQDLLMVVARVMLGWIFVMSGWGKLMNISGFVATMPRRGLPDFFGYIAPFVEFIGGVL